MDWRHRAACLTEDPELFFPVGNTGPALMQIAEAKKVCRRCDVRELCLQWALDAGQDHARARTLAKARIEALDRRIAELGQARDRLLRLAGECGADATAPCPILASFET